MTRLCRVLPAVLAIAWLAAPAEASHFRGAAMVPSVSASGLLTLTATSFWRPTFVASLSPQVSGLGGMTQVAISTDTSDSRFTKRTQVFTRQLPFAGSYQISASSCCRVAGIRNASESTFTMNSAINWNGVLGNTPIQFNFSAVQPEVVRGQDYVGNLGAVAGPGVTLSYDQNLNTSIFAQPPGFTVDKSTGALFIPAAATATYLDNASSNVGADYAFSGNIKASDGSFVEFDWLFDAVAQGTGNRAPVVDDASTTVGTGDTVLHRFTATDPEGQPLTWSFLGLLGPGAPAIAPVFDPLTQLFTWNTLGSALGTYLAQVQARDPFGLTDVGTLTINVIAATPGGAAPEPATLLLLGLGAAGVAYRRRFAIARS